jgi:hypothetical protein
MHCAASRVVMTWSQLEIDALFCPNIGVTRAARLKIPVRPGAYLRWTVGMDRGLMVPLPE